MYFRLKKENDKVGNFDYQKSKTKIFNLFFVKPIHLIDYYNSITSTFLHLSV